MNILLITTGGTIGSAFDGAAIDVRADGGCYVAEAYASEHPPIQFEIQSPLNILSERLSAGELNVLAETLLKTDFSVYDGVILTVGSDNLAYLAAFVGLLSGGCGVPVCLVASDKVPADPAANGYANFSCAVELIKSGMSGVYVPYRNSDGIVYVHEATDIRQADLSADFFSFCGAYAVYDGDLRILREPAAQHIPAVFDRDNLPRIGDNVLLIHPYPLQDYGRLTTVGVKAVLHTLYHSATLDSGAAAAFLRALGNTPMYLASFRHGQKYYQSAVEIIGAGAIPLVDTAPECAYMKLLLACAQDRMTVREFMEANE